MRSPATLACGLPSPSTLTPLARSVAERLRRCRRRRARNGGCRPWDCAPGISPPANPAATAPSARSWPPPSSTRRAARPAPALTMRGAGLEPVPVGQQLRGGRFEVRHHDRDVAEAGDHHAPCPAATARSPRRRGRARPRGPRRCAGRASAAARRTDGSVSENLNGMPSIFSAPMVGCSTVSTMSRAAVCGSASASATELILPHGTPAALSLREPGVGVVALERLVDHAVDRARGSRPAARLVVKRGSSAHSGWPSTSAVRANWPSLPTASAIMASVGLVGGVGHDARMAVAEAAAALAGHQHVGGDVDQHGERGLVERDLDLLALAGALARVERRQDRVARQHAGADVDDGDAVLGRPAVRLAADAHQAGLGLQDEVVAGQRRLRPARAVAGDRAAHHARRVALEPGVVEAPFVERAELEIVDQHVGLGDQPRQDLLPGRARQVERDRALVAVDAEEIRRLAVGERRAPAAGVVAACRAARP